MVKEIALDPKVQGSNPGVAEVEEHLYKNAQGSAINVDGEHLYGPIQGGPYFRIG